MKKIAVGDLGEFWYGDYKEPFEQLEGAVPGYPVGVVLKADDGKLLCAYCGKTYDSLGGHVHMHGLTATDYKEEVGLLKKSSLVSEKVRFRRIALGHQVRHHLPDWTGRDRSGEHRASGPHHGQWVPEQLNKTGRCYAQVLAVARSLMASGEGVTQRTLGRRGIRFRTIASYFGDIEHLRMVVGAPKGRRRYSDPELLEPLRNLAAELGRTPSRSDIHRFGLPTSFTYAKRFGSYSEACRRAGFDPNTPPSWDADFDSKVLVAYSRSASIARTATAVGAGEEAVTAVLHKYGFPFSQTFNRWNHATRKAWAADIARRLAGWPEEGAAA